MPFGIGSAPLVWGRVAAALGRLGQSLLAAPGQGRLQLYVDDPNVAVAGTRAQRERHAAVVLATWSAVGARLAWPKARLGKDLQWIGARYIVGEDDVTATIGEDRIAKLSDEVSRAQGARGLAFNLRRLAGELSWVAGVAPRVRPF
eukprot:1033279-Lingulodinium_polyedra.AAC.1